MQWIKKRQKRFYSAPQCSHCKRCTSYGNSVCLSVRLSVYPSVRPVSVNFCIGQAECPPYFYFRSSWPTDLESVSRDAHLAATVSTNFEVDTTIHCLVIALLLLIRYVTLWPWPLTFWLWSVVIHGGSRGQLLHKVWRSYGYPFLSYEVWHLP